MDVSKACGTPDHNILTKKLQYHSVIGSPLKWFEGYWQKERNILK